MVQCHFCDRQFNNAAGLGSHMRVHKHEKNKVAKPAEHFRPGRQFKQSEPRDDDDDDDLFVDDDNNDNTADVNDQQLDGLEISDWLVKRSVSEESRHHVPDFGQRIRGYERYGFDCPVQRLRSLDKEYLQASQVCRCNKLFHLTKFV